MSNTFILDTVRDVAAMTINAGPNAGRDINDIHSAKLRLADMIRDELTDTERATLCHAAFAAMTPDMREAVCDDIAHATA